ncbi:DUF6358 family protein [Mucilaginibacter sp.]|uniref:DUF6358 family protein n=1 Tax=Mucilaginibacter sp. TaxID=1882438 RepID=UPI003D09FD9A
MWKKVLPNVLYNIGIFLCLITGYQYGIVQKQYGFLFGALVMIAIFIVLKIRILKDIKNNYKK